MHRHLRNWLIGLGLAAVCLVVFDRGCRYLGVGFVDVTVEFVVTDAEGGEPIKGAEISGRGNLDENGFEDSEFKLMTDEQGLVQLVVRNVMFTSDESGLGFTTYSVYPVAIAACASAPGFAESGPISMRKPGSARPIRTGPGQAKLVVPISLRKSQP